eukprot:NODE_309_length_11266_cov_0.459479.p3 type:complete len:268 gc:universal NODE_309_length_11266_cov_0.459479:9426-8623(-)
MDAFVISTAIWGGTISLALQYLLNAVITFEKKYNKMFIGIVCAIFLCVLESTIAIHYIYYSQYNDNPQNQLIMGSFFAFTWFSMIQVVTWLYVLRIDSLGKYCKFDKCCWTIPYFIGVFELFTVIGIVLHATQIDSFKNYYRYSSLVFTVISILLEIFMTYLLIKKLSFILEYRDDLLAKLGLQIKVACVAVVLLEVAIIVLKFYGSFVDVALRPFTYIVRIYVIIQFYDDLIMALHHSNSSGLAAISELTGPPSDRMLHITQAATA